LVARIIGPPLTDLADDTLDRQYFIWKGHASGDLLSDGVIYDEPLVGEIIRPSHSGSASNPAFSACLIWTISCEGKIGGFPGVQASSSIL